MREERVNKVSTILRDLSLRLRVELSHRVSLTQIVNGPTQCKTKVVTVVDLFFINFTSCLV